MPVHDWTNVTSGIFHDFHQSWAIEIRRALNGGLLPPGFSAMAEQWAGGKIPDVLTLQSSTPRRLCRSSKNVHRQNSKIQTSRDGQRRVKRNFKPKCL